MNYLHATHVESVFMDDNIVGELYEVLITYGALRLLNVLCTSVYITIP